MNNGVDDKGDGTMDGNDDNDNGATEQTTTSTKMATVTV